MNTAKIPRAELGYEETRGQEVSMMEELEEIQGKDPDFKITIGKEVVTIPEAVNELEKSTPKSKNIREPFSGNAEY